MDKIIKSSALIFMLSACAPITSCPKLNYITEEKQVKIAEELISCGKNCENTTDFITNQVMETWAKLEQC